MAQGKSAGAQVQNLALTSAFPAWSFLALHVLTCKISCRLYNSYLQCPGQAAGPRHIRHAKAGHSNFHRQGLPARHRELWLRSGSALPHTGSGLLPLDIRSLADRTGRSSRQDRRAATAPAGSTPGIGPRVHDQITTAERHERRRHNSEIL